MYEKLKAHWQSEKKNIIFCFAVTFILGLAAHAYIMFNNAMSHDWLNAFVATDVETTAKISVSRYIVPLYRAVFRNSIALPWLVGMLSLFWHAATSYLVTKIFDVKSRIVTILISGIIITNITVTAQFATYLHEADCNALALFLATAAAYVWKKHTKIYQLIPSVIFLFISMGIYQSYVCVTIALMICVSILELFVDKDIKDVVKRGLLGIIIILVGFIIYHFVGQLVRFISGVELEERVNALFVFSSYENVFEILFKSFLTFVRKIFHSAYDGELLIVIFALTACAMFYLLICIFVKRKYTFSRIALIIVLFAIFPIGACAINILVPGSESHDLMIYAVWTAWIMVVVLVSYFSKITPRFLLKNISCGIIYISVAVIIWQNIVIANTAYIKKDLVAQSTFSTMTRVLDRIEQHPDYVHGQTQVLFVSVSSNDDTLIVPYENIPDFTDVNLITFMYPNCAISQDTISDVYNAYAAYFKFVLNSPIVICDADTRRDMAKNEALKDMPVYPAENSIQIINGVLVVKMGKWSNIIE